TGAWEAHSADHRRGEYVGSSTVRERGMPTGGGWRNAGATQSSPRSARPERIARRSQTKTQPDWVTANRVPSGERFSHWTSVRSWSCNWAWQAPVAGSNRPIRPAAVQTATRPPSGLNAGGENRLSLTDRGADHSSSHVRVRTQVIRSAVRTRNRSPDG